MSRLVLLALCVPIATAEVSTDRVEWVPYGKMRDLTHRIVRVEHLDSGRVVELPQGALPGSGGALRGTDANYFDSLWGPCPTSEPNQPLNFAFRDEQGEVLCRCPVDPNRIDSVAVLSLNGGACGDPNQALNVFPELGIVDPLQYVWDNYEVAGSCDPNKERWLFDWTYALYFDPTQLPSIPQEPYRIPIVIGYFEDRDRDGDGLLELESGYGFHVSFAPCDPGGLFSLRHPGASDVFEKIRGRGLLMVALGPVLLDQYGRPTELPLCGVSVPIAGGVPDRVDCDAPHERLQRGSVLTPEDYWWVGSQTQGGSAGPPWDPNVPLDWNTDGDPDSRSFDDLLNGGLQADLDLGLAHGIPFYLHTTGPDCLCGRACDVEGGDADVNGDCVVDLADLSIVLSNYGETFFLGLHTLGDTDSSSVVGFQDLVNVLGVFGTACPP